MAYGERKTLIEELEAKRNSKIITLVISDRISTATFQGISAQIAPDQILQVIEHLKLFTEKEFPLDKIELFIYSRGGDINTAWTLVNTIRSYTSVFNVLIPMHAESSATLISLGANEILMSKTATLSPVDPTVANAFNPKENNTSLGISVEDVTSFFKLAKDEATVGIKDEANMTEVFNSLTRKVHPLALGNVKRSHTQIRLLSKKLLESHLEDGERDHIEKIIDELTEKLYTHYHLIYREEAKVFGLTNIKDADVDEEKLLWAIYKDYEVEMKLKDIFDGNAFLGADNEKVLETTTVFIESTERSSAFKVKQKLRRALNPDPNHRFQVLINSKQFSSTTTNLKTQLLNIKTNATTVNAQLAGLIAATPGLNAVSASLTAINTQVDTLVRDLKEDLDVSDLKMFTESIVMEIGWV